jgi:hypothetical protein
VLRLFRRIGFGLAFGLGCSAAFAQADFSADIVNRFTENAAFHTRIFSANDRLRFQGQDKSGRTNGITIVNLATRTSIVLIPQQHQYVENKGPQIPGQGVTFFQAKDVEDACPAWRKMAPSAKGKCRKVGHETVNGRDAVKYEVSTGKGNTDPIWIDVKLHSLLKWQSAEGWAELRNIQEGAQPVELFEIPAGYTKRAYGSPARK